MRACAGAYAARIGTWRVLLVSLTLLASFLFVTRHVPDPFLDFRAFYCAGQADGAGVDPYREHPLHECERHLVAPGLPPMKTPATVPAPFPGFVLAFFAAVGLLPFPAALGLWVGLSCAALAIATRMVAATTKTPLAAGLIVLGFPAAIVALPLGQLTPFILLAMAGCATLLAAKKPRLAALAALGATLDPHVGLALCLGLFVILRQTRAVLALGAVTLTALGWLVSGPLRDWEYVHAVLPAHAVANVADAAQFSATNFAFFAGASPSVALCIGSGWYIAALVGGIAVAFRLRRQYGTSAVAFVPTAFAVFGGTYTHLQQLGLAIPAFLLLTSQVAGERRKLVLAATFIGSMPWLLIAPYPAFFVVPTLLAYLCVREAMPLRQAVWLASATFATLWVVLLTILAGPTAPVRGLGPVAGNPLADVSWHMFTLARNDPAQTWSLVARAPTVGAFLLLLGLLARVAAPRGHPA